MQVITKKYRHWFVKIESGLEKIGSVAICLDWMH